ncbi:YeeE/YedE family protein [Telmatospirillum sp.]|uniref:YeeE/YedE family protein n=1 Tax=Telmatospirillum sp. TaxID=2079197 RepID=UPI00283FDF06|nr:YeeE/YedE family protein [Telmatospirillum sp.]MDR3435006.1 YeeE/YedE family protein [Telmatospirillum sp.]
MPSSFDLSIDAQAAAAPIPRLPEVNRGVVAISSALLVVGAVWLAQAFSWRHGVLFLVGAGAGVGLYHASFGFTSAWRVFLADRRGAGLRAQMLMLALAVLVFFPLLAHGSVFGQPVKGEIGAVGLSVVAGAFMFGIGMQLGGGCASGTLFTVGGGNARMLVTLAAFIAGSAIGAYHLPWWSATPNVGPISLIATLGWGPALLLNLALFAGIAWLSLTLERRRHGAVATAPAVPGGVRLLRGPWPLVWGAVALVLVNVATLLLAGRPWGVTSGFALWGSKLAEVVGFDVGTWTYWANPARAASLHASVFADITSVMDFGIVLGAMAAAGLAGKFSPSWHIPARSLVAAVIGGLLMGYGARLAYGCNIGAFFSGIASSSLHGWLWFAMALAGSYAGTKVRPFFGLSVERARNTGC